MLGRLDGVLTGGQRGLGNLTIQPFHIVVRQRVGLAILGVLVDGDEKLGASNGGELLDSDIARTNRRFLDVCAVDALFVCW